MPQVAGESSVTVETDEKPAEPETAVEPSAEEAEAIAESARESAAGETVAPVVAGPAPMSHAEGKVPANKRPKSEELKTPWSDGRTFPGTPKNAQCPCGSGRKYKMCHANNEA